MKTIGELFKEARHEKKKTVRELADVTKIKKEFIKLIENEDWDRLPSYPVVMGFVKRVAQALDLEEQKALAFFRRDYPPSKTVVPKPKPDLKKEFHWSPKVTFFLGVFVIIFLVFGYIVFQYIQFISPPRLEVITPQAEQVVDQDKLEVIGITDPDATVKVNNQPALVSEDGKFTTVVEISQSTQEVNVVSRSRSGKESLIVRKIKVEFK